MYRQSPFLCKLTASRHQVPLQRVVVMVLLIRAPPMASVTIRNLLLYTTNEIWEVVNLKEAREFSSNTKYIYVFKKLEWESLSIDLLPHPDMFKDRSVRGSDRIWSKIRSDLHNFYRIGYDIHAFLVPDPIRFANVRIGSDISA
ncbi:uncharacterized protein LOC107634335 isoform X3 [Arachis ipaensis]|nr:uncharacterized protein LOC107634335 isoform X3 [Arachis ipaensis]